MAKPGKKKRPHKIPDDPQPRKHPPEISDIVLDNITGMLEAWAPQPTWSEYFAGVKRQDKNILQSMLRGAINQYGKEEIAQRLDKSAKVVIELVERILYDSGGKNGREQTQFDLQRFSEILMERPLTVNESKEITQIAETLDYVNPEQLE